MIKDYFERYQELQIKQLEGSINLKLATNVHSETLTKLLCYILQVLSL